MKLEFYAIPRSMYTTEFRAFTNIFVSEEEAFMSGILLFETLFDVHRFYPTEKPSMVYGRKNGDKTDSEGVGVLRVLAEDCVVGKTIFITCSFKLPCLTTRAITKLRDFCRQYRKLNEFVHLPNLKPTVLNKTQ